MRDQTPFASIPLAGGCGGDVPPVRLRAHGLHVCREGGDSAVRAVPTAAAHPVAPAAVRAVPPAHCWDPGVLRQDTGTLPRAGEAALAPAVQVEPAEGGRRHSSHHSSPFKGTSQAAAAASEGGCSSVQQWEGIGKAGLMACRSHLTMIAAARRSTFQPDRGCSVFIYEYL